ncbi:MAG: methionyl-tRNA formyltransferase [Alphaproteobacteria bacterium]|nr:methionyl-tRNA formyltransferase [Alphaproteobacteria bacterium]
MTKLRAIFMGTPEFVIGSLELVAAECELVGVFTKAPAPVGRKQILTPSPVAVWAEANAAGVPVITPRSLRKQPEFVEEVRSLKPDIIIVFAYGLILPQSVLDIAPCVCVHPSALPLYRGMNPIGRAIWNGDSFTEVDLIAMDAGVDTGAVLLRRRIELNPSITRGALEEIVAAESVSALRKYLAAPADFPPVAQEGEASMAAAFSAEELAIDFSLPARAVLARINALLPTPAGYFVANGEKIKIHSAVIPANAGIQSIYKNWIPGQARYDNGRLFIMCSDDVIEILRAQRPGGKILAARDFLNGFKI